MLLTPFRIISILTCSFTSSVIAQSSPVSLDINGLKIQFDGTTGSLIRLEYPGVGVLLDSPADRAGLLDVAYPIEEFVPMRLGSRFSKASVKRDGDTLTISWDPLGPSRTSFKLPEGRVHATVTIRPAPDNRSIVLQAKIVNDSKALIPQVIFPDLHGLKAFASQPTTMLRFGAGYPIAPFTEEPIPPHSAQFYVNSGWKEYPPSTGIYGMNTLRWLDFGGYSGGLSVHERAWGEVERATVRTYRTQGDPGSLRLMWDHRIRVEPGQTWQSAEYWLTPHRGGWAKGIEPYREYARQHIASRPAPGPQVTHSIGFQTIWLAQAPEKDAKYMNFRFTDIPKVAQDAKAHGLSEIVLWGWCHYFQTPWRVREECGTADELVEAVRKSKEIGVIVSPFVSCYLNVNRLASRYGAQAGQSAWVYHPDMVPMMDPYYMGPGYPVQFWGVFNVDPHNQNYHTDVMAAFKEWMDRGITSWSWDQVFADKPGTRGLTDLLFDVRKMQREKDPQASFSGEQVTNMEWDNGLLDYTWNWLDYTDAGPMTNVFRTPRLNCNIEDSPRIVKAAFIDNLFLNVMPRKPDQPNGTALISEKPELSKVLKEVAHLHEEFRPFLSEGTFIGDSVLSEPCNSYVRGYVLAGKPDAGEQPEPHRSHLLVFVMNNQVQAMPVTFKTQLDLWLPAAGTYTIQSFDAAGQLIETGTHHAPSLSITTRTLQPLEIAVYNIQAEEQN